jgi:hypothetical protein
VKVGGVLLMFVPDTPPIVQSNPCLCDSMCLSSRASSSRGGHLFQPFPFSSSLSSSLIFSFSRLFLPLFI